MTSVVLGGLGAWFGGPVVGTIGAAAGSVIDNMFLYPAMFGKKDSGVGPERLLDVGLQSGMEGTPLAYVLGIYRLSGTVIWLGTLQTVTLTQSVGGKGGNDPADVQQFEYYRSIAIAFCEGEIEGYKRVYADGNLFWDELQAFSSGASTVISAERIEQYDGGGNLTHVWLNINSDMGLGGPDFVALGFTSQSSLTVSGFTNGENNGVYPVNHVTNGGPGVPANSSQIRIHKNMPATQSDFVTESAGASISLSQNNIQFGPSLFDSISFHVGSNTQTADSIISAEEGAANTPGYVGTAYMVISRLNLSRFGNRLPIFHALVKQETNKTIRTGVGDLIERAGFSAGDYDTSGVGATLYLGGEGQPVGGYSHNGPQPINTALEVLSVAYDLVIRESNSKFYILEKQNIATTDLSDDDFLGASESTINPNISISDVPTFDLPSEVDIGYLESNSDYQSASQRERLINYVEEKVVSFTWPLVLDSSYARKIAHRLLWAHYSERMRVSFTLPPSEILWEESDIIRFNTEGVQFTVRLQELNRGVNFLVEATGVIVETQQNDVSQVSGSTPSSSNFISSSGQYAPVEALWLYLNLPSMLPQHATESGFYSAICETDANVAWLGANLYKSLLSGGSYSLYEYLPIEAIIGKTQTTLSAPAQFGIWDYASTVTIELYKGTLSSSSEINVLNGANRIVIGDEIIGFVTATLVSTRVYTLSSLLRGLRNTEDHSSTHAVNERVALLTTNTIGFILQNVGQVGIDSYWKPVPYAEDLANVVEQIEVFSAETLRPFSPANLAGKYDPVTDDLVLTWNRQSRQPINILGGSIPPLLELVEKYELDFVNASSVVVRTATVTGVTTFTYTSAMQTTDGVGAANSITVRAYQISGTLGRGNEVEDSFPIA